MFGFNHTADLVVILALGLSVYSVFTSTVSRRNQAGNVAAARERTDELKSRAAKATAQAEADAARMIALLTEIRDRLPPK